MLRRSILIASVAATIGVAGCLKRESATRKDFEAAERKLVLRYSARLDETVRVAPPQIKADVRKLIA